MGTSIVSGGPGAERRRLDDLNDDQTARLRANDDVIGASISDHRQALRAVLATIRKELHTKSSRLGGLNLLAKTSPSAYPVQHLLQAQATELRPLVLALLELEASAKDVSLGPVQVNQLLLDAKALLGQANSKHMEIMDDKLSIGADALQAVGLKGAIPDLQAMLAESAVMKITDAPNPYYGMPKADFLRLGLSAEMAKLYAPAHRYLHVDGDERVNGAKTAAAHSAREQIDDIDEDHLRTHIRVERGSRIRDELLESDNDELRAEVIVDQMTAWYRSSGADLLARLDIPEIAGIVMEMRRDPNVASLQLSDAAADSKAIQAALDQLNSAATKFYDYVKETGFDRTAFERKVDALVEKEINLHIGRHKGKIIEERLMTVPDYWVKLGEMALSAEYGRCFSCAGVAILQLVKNPKFDGYVLESVGAVSYDHHFVLVGRDNVGSSDPPGDNTLVVDIWQANQGADPPMVLWKDFTYNKETTLKVFCTIPAGDRSDLRARCGLS